MTSYVAKDRDGIKCDETDKVVSEIQGSFDSVSVRNARYVGWCTP